MFLSSPQRNGTGELTCRFCGWKTGWDATQHEAADKNPILAKCLCLWTSIQKSFFCVLHFGKERAAQNKKGWHEHKTKVVASQSLSCIWALTKMKKQKKHQDCHEEVNQWSVSALKSLIKAPLSYTTTIIQVPVGNLERAKFRNKTTALVLV